MKEVHLVRTVSPSDAGVVAVYENLGDAEALVALFDERDERDKKAGRYYGGFQAYIDTCTLGESNPRFYPFECIMSRDGAGCSVRYTECCPRLAAEPYRSKAYGNSPEMFHAWGVTSEQAVKNCNDFRLAYLAGQFPEM